MEDSKTKDLTKNPVPPIIFFDGICKLCNSTVDYILKKDTKRVFQFAPLQGKTAEKLLGKRAKKKTSVILYQDGVIYEKSDAIIQILPRLGMLEYQVSLTLKKIPKQGRDRVYDFIAKLRYVIFGKRDQCRLPSSEEADRFLD